MIGATDVEKYLTFKTCSCKIHHSLLKKIKTEGHVKDLPVLTTTRIVYKIIFKFFKHS